MFRPLAIIVAAIMLSRPGMPEDEAKGFARVLQQEAKEHGFDPLTGVAIIHFESGWYPAVVSANGEDYGLGQIRARYIGACRNDDDPLHQPSAECQKVKQSLLDATVNIRKMADLITNNRKLCKDKTGSALFHQWLASYQGLNFPKQKKWCQAKKKTWRVIEYRKELIRRLYNQGKAKAAPPKSSKPSGKSPGKSSKNKAKPGKKSDKKR